MYSIQVHTSDSTADYGTNIASTDKLKAFLCALDMKLVTHLEVNYYRELEGASIPTAPMDVITIPSPPSVGEDNKPDDWEPDTMGLPL